MKPPSRQRSAPARYDLGPVAHVWTDQEKRRLLKALRAHTEGPLRPELLKKYLPWRDEAEILAFVQLLKERVAREAVKAQYQSLKRQRQDGPTPAPIEVWTELAEKLTGGLENSVTTAFSQVLTIASTEPLSLLHSVPPKPVDTKNPQYPSSAAHDEQREKLQTVILPSNAEQAPAEQQGFHVDFEKIYKYLSMLSSGSKVPELSPGVHTITTKPMSWHDNLEEPADDKFLKLFHHAALEPTKKYKEPQTESQEIGWFSTPLISTDRNDSRLNFPSRSTEITKYMAAMWRLKEMMKDNR